jgi:hypothetical protein
MLNSCQAGVFGSMEGLGSIDGRKHMKADKKRKAARAQQRADMKTNLLAVAEALRDVPDEQFNMNHWWLEEGMAFDDNRNVMYKVADGPCGCAVGHLIQRGLLSGKVLEPKDLPQGALPYQYTDRIYVQIADALKIYNYKLAEFLFSQYAYTGARERPIAKEDVIRRILFVVVEIDAA